jgi:hypothetical protein
MSGRVAQDRVRERARERADPVPVQRREGAQREAAPDDELLGEGEIRTRDERLRAHRRRVLDSVQRDVEVAPRERGEEIAPIILDEPGANA